MTSDDSRFDRIVGGLENRDLIRIFIRGGMVSVTPVVRGLEVCTIDISSPIVRTDSVRHVTARSVEEEDGSSELVLDVGGINEIHLPWQEVVSVGITPVRWRLPKRRIPFGRTEYVDTGLNYASPWDVWYSLEPVKRWTVKKSKTLRRI